ncbi:uncharacterized protein LOC132882489 [Neoarius graeffei]|uniref:uncharacterized protein LOC132882489 n=1 Tax=Neoarius graeffei TaxID=443677 RepID=UPI00298C6D03|nr:uncharacterized protein LOC132882489 [Neoarius graeffei]
MTVALDEEGVSVDECYWEASWGLINPDWVACERVYDIERPETPIKTSGIKELHVKTVKRGEAVTMECNFSMITNKKNLLLFRQSFGKVPQFLAKPYTFDGSHVSITVNGHKFDLNVRETRKEDGGEYFCAVTEGTVVKFISGTRLQFEGEEIKCCPTPGTVTKNTDCVTHQGSSSTYGNVGVITFMLIIYTIIWIVFKLEIQTQTEEILIKAEDNVLISTKVRRARRVRDSTQEVHEC